MEKTFYPFLQFLDVRKLYHVAIRNSSANKKYIKLLLFIS